VLIIVVEVRLQCNHFGRFAVHVMRVGLTASALTSCPSLFLGQEEGALNATSTT